jgi:hypothetical protein
VRVAFRRPGIGTALLPSQFLLATKGRCGGGV